MTPCELLRTTARLYREAGIPDPETDSALLLSFLTGKPPLFLRLDTETELSGAVLETFSSLSARRLTREPLQYITGEAPFFRRVFTVDSRVLIPRPETELLCSLALELLPEQTGVSVLDLCCGSGCIGLTLAAERPSLRVTLSDLSPDALSVAEENARRFGLQVSFHCGDLTEGLPSGFFDCVISNPPYIPSPECPCLQPEVLREPALALDGGPDGLDFYRRMMQESVRVLRKPGYLLLEVGAGEAEKVCGMMKSAGFSCPEIREDLNGIPRMVYGTLMNSEDLCSTD